VVHSEEITLSDSFRSTRDFIIRTDAWEEATAFYSSVLEFSVAHQSETITGFETGAFRLYVERGDAHGPVFELLVPDVQAAKLKLLAAGCRLQEENASVPRCYIRDPYGVVFNLGQARSGK
jgi:predicted enzyme related to lactoylglutathione lyase